MIGSGLDMEMFIVIVLTGTVQPLVLCVPDVTFWAAIAD